MAYDSSKEDVVKELDEIKNGYKTRILATSKGEKILDIREYVDSESFSGFTKRGLRLDLSQVQKAIEVLSVAETELG